MNLVYPLSRARLILAIDSGAALVAGLLILTIPLPLADWYGLPNDSLTLIGIVNLAYGAFSGSLVGTVILGKLPKRFWIDLLINGNLFWSVVCIGILTMNWSSLNLLGIVLIAFEGVFVAVLAVFEFRVVRPATI
ncbi:hypothetical protein AB3N59_13895 [Leptospira sp. WS92.C1]